MPKWNEFMFGKREQTQQTQLYTPQQQKFFDMVLNQGGQGVSSGMYYLMSLISGEEGAFDAFEAPLRREYEEQTIPGLAERFAGLDAQGSSAFGQSLGAAGAGLTENLAALRHGLKMQAIQGMQSFANMGTGQRFESTFRPASGGFIGGMAPGFSQGAGEAAGVGISRGASAGYDWLGSLGSSEATAAAVV